MEEEPNSVRIQTRTLVNARLLLHAFKSGVLRQAVRTSWLR